MRRGRPPGNEIKPRATRYQRALVDGFVISCRLEVASARLCQIIRGPWSRSFGEPPHRYVSRRRMEYARQLLQGTGPEVNEIAEKVGLKNNTMLSPHMRKLVDFAPL
jgi:AraC family transcriptional regulator